MTVVPGPDPDSAVTDTDTPVTIDVKANDAGAATTGPPTTTTQPQHGTAQVTGMGSYLYTPDAGFDGTDTFAYQICSLAAPTVCGSTTVTIDVEPPPPPNEPPIVEDLTVQTSAGLPVEGIVPATDPEGDSLTFAVTTAPGQGTVALATDASFVYTPTGNTFAGIDTFVVTACDPSDACDSGTVTVRILPIAQPISLIAEALTATGVDVFAHVNGAVGPPTITQPENGTALIISAGNVEYLPTGSFTGQDPFDYMVCAMGIPVGVEPLCDQSVIQVDVYPIAVDNMVATTPNHPVTVNLALNDPGDALDATLIGAPTHGQMTNLGGNEATYTPDGTWTGIEDIGYQRCSAGAVPLCAQALVVITVVPLLHDDGALTLEGQPVTVDVYANDEGEAGLASIVSGPAAGQASVVGFQGITYTPNADFTGDRHADLPSVQPQRTVSVRDCDARRPRPARGGADGPAQDRCQAGARRHRLGTPPYRFLRPGAGSPGPGPARCGLACGRRTAACPPPRRRPHPWSSGSVDPAAPRSPRFS